MSESAPQSVRSSASNHGRIVTENPSLLSLLKEKTDDNLKSNRQSTHNHGGARSNIQNQDFQRENSDRNFKSTNNHTNIALDSDRNTINSTVDKNLDSRLASTSIADIAEDNIYKGKSSKVKSAEEDSALDLGFDSLDQGLQTYRVPSPVSQVIPYIESPKNFRHSNSEEKEDKDLGDQRGRSSRSPVDDKNFNEQEISESLKDSKQEEEKGVESDDNESVKKGNLLHPELVEGTPRHITPRHERFSAGRSNTRTSTSSVYAVANPAVLVAQGDTPTQQNVQFTPRVETANKEQKSDTKPLSDSEKEEELYDSLEKPASRKSGKTAHVSFGSLDDSDLNRESPTDRDDTPTNWDTPRDTDIQERVPTPHPSSPQKSPVKLQEEFQLNSPKSTPVNSPEPVKSYVKEQSVNSASSQKKSDRVASGRESSKSRNSSKLKSEKSVTSLPTVKRVYIDSPTFTKEEENEYRFVESRLETGNDDLDKTFRELENKAPAKRKKSSGLRNRKKKMDDSYDAQREYQQGDRDDRYDEQRDDRNGNYGDRYDRQDEEQGSYADQYNQRRDNDQYDRQSNKVRDNDQYDRRSGQAKDNDHYDRRSNHARDNDQYDRQSNHRDNDQYDPQSNQARDNDHYDRRSDHARDNDRYERRSNHARDNDQYEQRSNHARENDKGYSDEYDRQDVRDRRQSYDKYDDRHQDRRQSGDRYTDKNNEINRRQSVDRYEDRNERQSNDRYEDRDRYRDERYRNRDRYEDRNEQMDDSHAQYRQERDSYDRRQDDDSSPSEHYRRQRYKSNIDDDLEREREYQNDLRHRIDSQSKKDSEIVIPRLPLNMESEDYVQDSLDFDAGGNNDWGNPPPNPYGVHDERYPQDGYHQQHRQQHYNIQQQQQQQSYQPRQRGVQDFVDQLNTARMEIFDPSKAKYDYVENNKVDYGRVRDKNYKSIVQKRKEAEEKLEKYFISPKTKPKQQRQLNKVGDNSYYSPLADFHSENQMSTAEEMWAQRSAALSKKKAKTASGTIQKKQGLQKYPSDSGLFRVPGQSNGVRMYGTPTRNHFLEPLGQRPMPPQNNDSYNREPPGQVARSPPFKKPLELKPITQQIVTEDGQKISVDINLKVVSPPPPHSQIGGPPQVEATVIPRSDPSPDRHLTGQQYPLPYFRQDQAELMTTYAQYEDAPPLPPPQEYHQQQQQQQPYGGDVNMENNPPHYQQGYYGYDNAENVPPPPPQNQFNDADYSQPNYNPYNTIPPINSDRDRSPDHFDENGYAAMYKREKDKDPNAQPWYQVYTIKDYRRMVKEVKVNRGPLGPDLDNETYKEKLEKRYKQIDYARMVMEKNRQEYGDRKPPAFPKPKEQNKEESRRRQAAMEYAKNVPKPAIKQKPNQYNSYEVASQLSPANKRKSPVQKVQQQTIDVIDLKKLQQRHEQDKQNVASIRQNIEA